MRPWASDALCQAGTAGSEAWRAWLRPSLKGVASLGLGVAASSTAEAHEFARGSIEATVEYTVDIVGPVAGASGEIRVLDNLDISARFDMAGLAGWQDTTLFVHLLNNSGEAPNDEIGTLQGVDNIEVERHRLRLYEFWLETQVGAANLRAGLYDLNSEFYANESASLLIGPAFGIGSELAATGPNGPSIFPSTALAARVQWAATEHTLIKLAVLNAAAGVLGDPGGVDTTFEDGALVVAEWSWLGDTRLNVGAWAYGDRQDDIREVDLAGDPLQRRAFGGYVTLERTLWDADSGFRETTAFLRAGLSDGDTTPFDGGWQAGLLFKEVARGRPDSMLSIGFNQALISDGFRQNQIDIGIDADRYEGAIEITYADTFGPLTIQPDLQFISNPGGDGARDDAVVGVLRFSASF